MRVAGNDHPADHKGGDEKQGNAAQEFSPVDFVHHRRVNQRTQNEKHGVSKIHVREILNTEVNQKERVAGVAAKHDARHGKKIYQKTQSYRRALARIDGYKLGNPMPQSRRWHINSEGAGNSRHKLLRAGLECRSGSSAVKANRPAR